MSEISKQNFFGVENPKWWMQNAPGTLQLCYPWATAFGQSSKYYSPGYSILVVSFKDDAMWQILDEGNNIELARALHLKVLNNPKHLDDLIGAWRKYRDVVVGDFGAIDNDGFLDQSDEEIWRLYDHLYTNHIEALIPSVAIEAFSPYAESYLIPKLTSSAPDSVSVHKEVTVLTTPLETSFVTRERLSLLELILEVRGDKKLRAVIEAKNDVIVTLEGEHDGFAERLKRHQQEYFWVTNNYVNTPVLTVDNFLGGIRQDLVERTNNETAQEKERLLSNPEQLKQQKQELLSKLRLSSEVLSLVKLFERLGHWQDQRKEEILKANHYIAVFLKEIARRTKVPLPLLHYYLPQEIHELLKESALDSDLLEKRRSLSIFVTRGGQEKYVTGDEAKLIFSVLFDEVVDDGKPLAGIVASTGHAAGKVRVIKDPHKATLEPGEILVTSMTRPEFVPLMKKAAAIITDEGGLTSHAAIVSRELGIPCIVGTKTATKILKNGDEVDVNASNGTVTKL